LFLIFINFASAFPQINLYSENIQPYETVSGNITSLSKTISIDDLIFYEGRKEVSFEKDLREFGGNYYFYVIFNREGNFTIKLENVFYHDEDKNLKSTVLERLVEVRKSEDNFSQVVSIKPGVVVSSSEVEFTLTNRGEQDLNITIGKNKTSLATGKSEKIKFYPNKSFSLFELKTYKTFLIPVIFYNLSNNEPKENISVGDLSLKTKNSWEIMGYENEGFVSTIEFFNVGYENLTKVSVNSNLKFLNLNFVTDMAARSSANLSVSGEQEEGVYITNISVSYEENKTNRLLILPTTIFVFKKNVSEEQKEKIFSCIDLGGSICSESSICNGNFSTKIQGCCLGLCSEKTKPSSSKGQFFVGFLILAALAFGAYTLYKKYKNVKPKEKIISS
jgi:hypothetical protein